MFRSLCVVAAFTAATICPASAQDLEPVIADWQSQTGVTGLSAAVWNGIDLETAVAGHRTTGGAAVAYDDVFAVASVTKTITAAAILVLANRGDISLDTPVSTASGTEFGANISVEDLLYHEAGIPEFIGGALSFETFLSEHAAGRTRWTHEEVVDLASAQAGTPDSDFGYSNSHYALLGQIIVHQTGKDLKTAMRSLVFEPAGLTSARLVSEPIQAPDALGFSAMLGGALGDPQFDPRLATELASLGHAAGGVAMTAGDMARWAALWFSGEFVEGQAYRSPLGGSAFGLASDQILIGAGAFDVRYGDMRLRLHGGDGLGVTALAIYDPGTDTAIALVQNDDAVRALGFGADGFLDSLALEILSAQSG